MNVLDRIIDTKRAEVVAKKACTSLAELDARLEEVSRPRGFRTALETASQHGYGLIAEIKKASPSKGLIRADFDPAAHARAYEQGGAACLSVLTDEHWFEGADIYLAQARDACTLPVLRKDFMVDPWQVHEARALGADAVLVIMAALDNARAAEIEGAARDCGMDVLVEVHDAHEVERACACLETRLIGVNNRDLRDFTVDPRRTLDLLGRMPEGALIVAESGIATHNDVAHFAGKGVRCFLVGESLMRQADLTAATRTLLGTA